MREKSDRAKAKDKVKKACNGESNIFRQRRRFVEKRRHRKEKRKSRDPPYLIDLRASFDYDNWFLKDFIDRNMKLNNKGFGSNMNFYFYKSENGEIIVEYSVSALPENEVIQMIAQDKSSNFYKQKKR
jgi:hypothetical protein